MKQCHKISLSATKVKGVPGMAFVLPEADVFVAFTSPDELMALAKAVDKAAKDLLVAQRRGARMLYLPNGHLKGGV